MEVLSIVEHEDGGATVTVEMNEKELQSVVELGLLKLLTDYSKTLEQEYFEEDGD